MKSKQNLAKRNEFLKKTRDFMKKSKIRKPLKKKSFTIYEIENGVLVEKNNKF